MARTHRILVVEDNELLRQMLARLLRRTGYEVAEAENGCTALQRMQEWPADLVITDMIMPRMDGVELILVLRRDHPHVKIIAMSGNGLTSAETQLRIARLLGTHEVLVKPLCPREFLGTIHGLIGAA